MTVGDSLDPAELIPAYASGGVLCGPLHWPQGGRCSCGRTCLSPAKHPLTAHGKDDFTTDLGQLAEWLARWPTCNWGIRPPVGVVVLDVDPRHGGDVELAQLEQQHGALPATLTAVTGSGGRHVWLSYNGPSRGKLCIGVDVKTNSGYLVAPPSIHICGGRYQWADQRPAAFAPRWVKTILNPPLPRHYVSLSGNAALDRLVQFVADSGEGELNNRLYWASCRAWEAGLDIEPLIDAAIGKSHPPRAARATAHSAEKAPRRKAAS